VFTSYLVDPVTSISCRTCATVAALEHPRASLGSGAVGIEPRRRWLMTSANSSGGRVSVEQRGQRAVVRGLEPVGRHAVRINEWRTQSTREQVGAELVCVEVAPRSSTEVNEL